MKNKNFIVFGVVFAIIYAITTFSFADAMPKSSSAKDKLEAYIKFTTVLSIIEEQYVDEVNITSLVDKALKGLMNNLDAHSSFMDTKSYKELSVQTKGEFGGLGISIGIRDGALTVIAPLDGTPAHKAGVKAKDIILKINDTATLGMSIDESVNLMRGKPNTDCLLTIIRKDEPKPLKINIKRDIIKIQSVYAKTIEDKILYLHITSFDSKVVDELIASANKYSESKGIILDLRNNPGGLLGQAIGVVDLFVDNGVIVSQKGKLESENVEYFAHKEADTKTPIVVLINGGSASASEIVSGALQDLKRAIVVGEKSFGKGSVQVVIGKPYLKDEALKLTVARYYLPSGRTIQAVGVTPDIIVHTGKIEYKEDQSLIKERDLKKHLESELEKIDGKKVKKEEEKKIDPTIITEKQLYSDAQLKSAVDILKALMLTQR